MLVGGVLVLGATGMAWTGGCSIVGWMSHEGLRPVFVATVVAIEASLGIGCVAFGGVYRVAVLALLVTMTGVLIARGLLGGWELPCGCLEGVWESSVAGGVARNAGLCGLCCTALWSGGSEAQQRP
jgi:hypothetical protein